MYKIDSGHNLPWTGKQAEYSKIYKPQVACLTLRKPFFCASNSCLPVGNSGVLPLFIY